MRVDIHQHIWTEPLLDRLAARATRPLVRRTGWLTVLHSSAERPYVVDVRAETPTRRASLLHDDGVDLAAIAISSPVGIEALPRDSALELIDAHLEGVAALSDRFVAWGPVALDGADARDVDELLARGCIGISLPAGALASRQALERLGPVLERAAARGVPLFVHPGWGSGQQTDRAAFGEPLWWRALTDYVAQMQAAWLAFAAFGRRDHPNLAVVFAMLAGCAPLHVERLAVRSGLRTELHDPLTFYDTSSYGRAAIETIAHRVGESQLVYGSDRPVIEPVATGREALLKSNGANLIAPVRAAA